MSGIDPTPAIEALRTSTEAGFRDLRTDLTNRLDQTVTRREHDAEVKRIDSEHKSLAEAHQRLEQTAETEHAELRKLVEEDRAARARSAELHRQERAADRRTYLTVTVAAVIGVATIVATVVLRFAN